MNELQIKEAQKKWSNFVIEIGRMFSESYNYNQISDQALLYINELYGFGERKVLFKPTRASIVPFRSTLDEALSYFVSGCIEEDYGFAKFAWQKINFINHDIIFKGNEAIVNGTYYFSNSDGEQHVEYTIGYYLSSNNSVKIEFHHSSFSFKG